MSKLIYITNTSLDGYVEDAAGAFNRVIPDQVHAFITELLRFDERTRGCGLARSSSPQRAGGTSSLAAAPLLR